MTVFSTTLRRLVFNVIEIVMLLVLPFVGLIPTIVSMHTAGQTIGVVDYDDSTYTANLIQRLEINVKVVSISRSDIEKNLRNGDIDYAIVIPKGFTDDLISGEAPRIAGTGTKDRDCSKAIGAAIDSFVTPSKAIASQVGGNRTSFYTAIKNMPAPIAATSNQNSKMTLGLIVQFMFMTCIFSASVLLTDKENKTFYRSLSAPISLRRYLLESILAFSVVTLFQLALFFSAACWIFKMDLGPTPALMLLPLGLAGVVGVSMGVAVSSLCRSMVQSVAVGLGFIILMCMFGGAWGFTPTSMLMKTIAKLFPFYWASDAIGKLLNGNGIAEIAANLGILCAFSVVFFLAGTWRRADVTK